MIVKMHENDSLAISLPGHGDHGTMEPHGCPVFIEFHEGQWVVYIWADINEEDPTHKIGLAGAKENRRNED